MTRPDEERRKLQRLATQAKYRAAHREKIRAKGRLAASAYYAANREKIRADRNAQPAENRQSAPSVCEACGREFFPWRGHVGRYCSLSCNGRGYFGPAPARIWNGIDQRGPDECWPWQRTRNKRGYGQTWFEGRLQVSHRVVWQLVYGEPAPSDHDVCHSCDNPPCCNPTHLFLGTRLENVRDMMQKGRAPWQRAERYVASR